MSHQFDFEPWEVGDPDGAQETINLRSPFSLSITATGVHVETMELLLGQQIIPLCERQIPCEGTE